MTSDHVLFVCTGNLCRSPLGEALLRARLAERGVDDVRVSSAGTLGSAAGATSEARSVAEEMGGDLSGHRSRRLESGLVASADLVIAMTADHVIDLVHQAPSEADRVFKLTELARRAKEEGPRRPGESLRAYAERLGSGRSERPWADSRDDPDVTDPFGETVDIYRGIAVEIERSLAAVIEHAWPT